MIKNTLTLVLDVKKTYIGLFTNLCFFKHKYKNQTGFTLIELMVTLVIVAILAAIALPSFTDMISDNRLLSEAQDMTNGIKLARSEAIKRGTAVSICPSTDGTSCSSSSSLDAGWIVFIDNTTPGIVDDSHHVTAGGNIIVYRNQQGGGSTKVCLVDSNGDCIENSNNFLRFGSQGFLSN